jgi:hypothetical protein
MFFNQLSEGMEIVLLNCARKDLPAGEDPERHGERGVIIKVPVYPSTWLTARKIASDKPVKVRTSKIALPRDAPPPSEDSVFSAIEEARKRFACSKVRGIFVIKNGACPGCWLHLHSRTARGSFPAIPVRGSTAS